MRNDWTETTLGELVKIQKGKKPPALDVREEASRPYLTADVLRGATCEQFISYALTELCIQLSGRETVLLWDGAGAGDVFKSQPGILASTMAKLEVRDSLAMDDGYLYLYLNFKQVAIKSSCRGTTVPHVSPEALKALNVSLPPLAEQKRIVDVVSSVDAYIDALQQQADMARTARNAVLFELLSAGGDDWTQTTVGELANFRRDRLDPLTLDSAHLLCHWSIPALDEFGGPLWEPAGKIGSHKFRVRENAVVFSLLNPRIPRFALVAGGDDVVCSTEFAVMQPTDLVHETFLFLLASSNVFQIAVGSLASGTTKSRERVKPSDLEGVSILLLPLDEQKRIVEIVSSMDEVIQSTEQAVIDAKNLRSGLLSDLLSGEHEIPESYDQLLGAA